MKTTRWQAALHSSPLITLVLGAAALAYTFLLFIPGQKSIRKLQAELREKQDFITQAAVLGTTIFETQQRVDEADKFAERWRGAAPDPTRMASVFAQVTSGAQLAGLKTLQFDPAAAHRLQTLQKLPVHMGVEGEFAEAFEFVRKLEELETPLWVEELHMEAVSENREDLQCELKMVVFAAHAGNSD